MRILSVFHTHNLTGGASISGLNLIRGLKDCGHEVCVVFPMEGTASEAARDLGIEVRIVPFRWALPMFNPHKFTDYLKFTPNFFRFKIINGKAAQRIVRIIDEFKPDIVHSNTSVIDVGFLAAQKKGLPHVTHYREFGFADAYALMWHLKKLKKYSRQYSISIDNEVAVKHKLLDSPNNKIIYNGIYFESQIAEPNIIREKYFLFVGGLYAPKGIEDLLTAYSKIPTEVRIRHHLKIAGEAVDPKYFEYLKQKSRNLGIDKETEWLGFQRDVASLMRKAHCLIIPSHNEAFGRIMAESMFNRCPVIARDTRGLKEQFDNGVRITGKEIGYRFNNVQSLTTAILELTKGQDRELLKMTDRALSVATKLYSTEAYVANVEKFFNKIYQDSRTLDLHCS